MSDNREARRRLRALDRRARRQITKAAGALTNQRILVNISTVIEATTDQRIMHGVFEMLLLAMGTATGETQGKRQCFVSCQPWGTDRWPVGVATMEVLGANRALVTLICGECFAGGADQAFQAAMQRDLGCRPEEMQIVHQPAQA